MSDFPVYTKEGLVEWADTIDRRLGPISGRQADALARLLRATATRIGQLEADRRDQDLALRDAISETARTADELAFWHYQAVHQCALGLWDARNRQPPIPESGLLEDLPVWKEADKMLEGVRVRENQERISHAEAPRCDTNGKLWEPKEQHTMTQQAKHTPGPWRVKSEPNAISGDEGDFTAWYSFTAKAEKQTFAEHEANARLMQNAPETAAERDRLKELNAELLAALKAWQVFARAKPSENDISLGATIPIKEFSAAQELTRIAIAKAEGR